MFATRAALSRTVPVALAGGEQPANIIMQLEPTLAVCVAQGVTAPYYIIVHSSVHAVLPLYSLCRQLMLCANHFQSCANCSRPVASSQLSLQRQLATSTPLAGVMLQTAHL
jgi:hypothetical protein